MKKNTSILGMIILVFLLSSCSGQNKLTGTYTMSPGLIGGSSNELILLKDGTGMVSSEFGTSDTFTWEYIKDTIYFRDIDMYSNTILSGTVNYGKHFTVISLKYNDAVYDFSLEKTGSAPNKLPESAPEIKNNTSVPISNEQLNAAKNSLGDTIVYWSAFGKVYHTHDDCSALNSTEQLSSGNVEDAIAANRTSLCKFCAERDNLD